MSLNNKCLKCGAINDSDSMYCYECGVNLRELKDSNNESNLTQSNVSLNTFILEREKPSSINSTFLSKETNEILFKVVDGHSSSNYFEIALFFLLVVFSPFPLIALYLLFPNNPLFTVSIGFIIISLIFVLIALFLNKRTLFYNILNKNNDTEATLREISKLRNFKSLIYENTWELEQKHNSMILEINFHDKFTGMVKLNKSIYKLVINTLDIPTIPYKIISGVHFYDIFNNEILSLKIPVKQILNKELDYFPIKNFEVQANKDLNELVAFFLIVIIIKKFFMKPLFYNLT